MNMAASASSLTTLPSPVTGRKTEETNSSLEINSLEEKYVQNDGDLASITAPDAGKVELDASTSAQEDQGRLKGFRLIIVVTSVMLALFCVALDNTIIATAIPRITDTFHTIDDVGWYGSAYLLATCSFQILYAKFYAFFNVKWIFLIALFIFEVGSLVCAVSPTSNALIVGRAIAGLGGAGIFTGVTTAITWVAPKELRPMLTGIGGGIYGFSSVFGPVLGGVFADEVTWRWCFYINLPIGALTAIGVLLFLHVDQQLEKKEGSIFEQIMRYDPIGNAFFICCIICLLLALQWGGTKYPYSNGKIIALFTLFGIFVVAFIAVEIYNGEQATIPTRVAKQRSIAFGTLFAFCISSTVFIVAYYLPIWFQVVRNLSPIVSAVYTFPLIFSQLIGTISSGAMTSKIGYYVPFIWASTILLPIGAGLLSTFSVDISTGKWVGYEILFGFGVGFGFQQGNVAAQVILAQADIPTGVAIMFSSMFLGGSIFLLVAQNIFTKHLRANIAAVGIPDFNVESVIAAGASELRSLVPVKYLPEVLVAYNDAIAKVFQIALIMSCLACLGAAGMEWRSVKPESAKSDEETTAQA